MQPSPLFNSGRQSPFKRQNSQSQSPATIRAATPTQSPTKATTGLSPTKTSSLSPDKASPFVRRPSQINQTSERATSPFARPTSSLSIPSSPSRQASNASRSEEAHETLPSRQIRVTPTPEPEAKPRFQRMPSDNTVERSPSPSQFDGTFYSPTPGGAATSFAPPDNLRPTVQRAPTSSTVSTIKQPSFVSSAAAASKIAAQPKLNNNISGASNYKNVPQPLLHSMRESFEVLDSNNTGSVNSASVASMLEQMGLDNTPAGLRDFFPPNKPAQLNLARYLDMLSAPLAELSPPEELLAAFSAFDVDDSGQIDVAELHKALLNTAPEPGEEMSQLSEHEIDSVLGEFSARRAFGAKGLNTAQGKGDVFRYRDFMGSIQGGSADVGGAEASAMAA